MPAGPQTTYMYALKGSETHKERMALMKCGETLNKTPKMIKYSRGGQQRSVDQMSRRFLREVTEITPLNCRHVI